MRMKALVVVASAIAVVMAGVGQVVAQTPVATPVAGLVEYVDIGLDLPESVLHDAVSDVYLVSSLGVDPFSEDGNGFITRLSPDGEVIAERWIDGTADGVELNAPKGSAIVDDTFYVADITVVRLFDRETGEPTGTIEVPGATFLNDMAAGPDGAVYVTDMGLQLNEAGEAEPSGTDAVYRITPDGSVEAIAAAPDVAAPNGVVVLESGDIAVAPFTEEGAIYSFTPEGERQDLAQLPAGMLDGIVVASDGSLLVSSWATSTIYRVDPSGEVSAFIEELASAADIGYDATRDVLLVPVMMENRVLVVPVGE